MTAQDVSTMLRCGQKTIIFLINNGGYTIEVEIHDGPYNVIKNWNYTGLIDAIHNGEGKCWTAKVSFLTLSSNFIALSKHRGVPKLEYLVLIHACFSFQVFCEEELERLLMLH